MGTVDDDITRCGYMMWTVVFVFFLAAVIMLGFAAKETAVTGAFEVLWIGVAVCALVSTALGVSLCFQ